MESAIGKVTGAGGREEGPLVVAEGLGHRFDYPLFEGLNFELKPGEQVAIVGASGSGKSTLLHILSSFLKPNRGRVELLGRDPYSIPGRELIQLRRREIGIIFQFHYLFTTFTGWENLEVASLLSGHPIDQQLIDRLGIGGVLHQNIQTLSGGQQQRVSIARVLVKRPRIIFADEPTGNLDRANGEEVIEILKEYTSAQNGGLIVVTHDLWIADKLEKIYQLENQTLTRIK